MGEVLLRDLGQGRISAFSAGSRPAGKVNPVAVALLQSKGHNIKGLRSKSWDEFIAPEAPDLHYVFTVCGSAAGTTCPVWIGSPIKAHWGVDDPSDVKASPEATYEATYDKLRRRVEAFLALPLDSMDAFEVKAALDKIGNLDD